MIKKLFIAALVVASLAIAALFAIASIDFNRLGKDNVYVQIVGPGTEDSFTTSTGEVYTRYAYTLPAYDKDGNEQQVTFTAHKQLREQAYLMMYINKDDEVTSYDEVQQADLPANVAEVISK